MVKDIFIEDEKSIMSFGKHGVLAVTASEVPALQNYDTLEKATGTSKAWKPWGSSDTYTKDVITRKRLHPFLDTVLNYKANTIAGGEMQYGFNEFSTEGIKTFKQIELPEIEDFLESNNIDAYRLEILRDLYSWNNAFAGFVRGLAKKDKIVQLYAQDATECRLEWQNPKTGLKDNIYVDANFAVGNSVSVAQKKIPTIDPYYWNFERYRKSSAKEFAQHLYFSTSSEKYYQRAEWHAFLDSKWFDVAVKIAAFKSALMDNQMAVRYIVHIPIGWWKWKYPTWDNGMSDADKKAARKKEADWIDEALTGTEKAGKSIMATFVEGLNGKPGTKWEIIAVDNKLMSGVYIEDSQEASLVALFSLAVHGAVIGNTPGKSQSSSGSGSDIRVASNQFIINNKVYDKKQLEPLRFITSFNQWKYKSQPIKWRIVHEMIQTSDKVNPENRP